MPDIDEYEKQLEILKRLKSNPIVNDNWWTQAEAIQLATEIEDFAPLFQCHIALTGGLLYKKGPRKDCDLLMYRIRQAGSIDTDGFFDMCKSIGVEKQSGFGWCYKATYKGKNIDFFFPEEQHGTYDGEDSEPLEKDGADGPLIF